jgi:hypothetical protein
MVQLKERLINNEQKKQILKIVKNVHFISKLEHHKIKKEILCFKGHAVIILGNNCFERIKFNKSNEIENLVNHLKWGKGKYRIGNIKLKSTEEVGEMLNTKNSFGFQVEENSFILWKFTVK